MTTDLRCLTNFEEDITMLNMKKITSLALALAMTAALAVPAFADDENTDSTPSSSDSQGTQQETASSTTASNKTVVTTTYKTITIAVTVPSTGTAQINPYGLPVEVKDSAGSATLGKITGQQITTAPMYISNDGDIALTVGATVSATASEGVNLVTKVNAKSTAKDIYAQVQMVAAPDSVAGAKAAIGDLAIKACIDDANWTSANSLAVSTSETSNSSMVTLAKNTMETDGSLATYAKGAIALVRLTGSVTESPADDWAETDSFTTTIAYTFKPASNG
jgi:ribosomal protein L30E